MAIDGTSSSQAARHLTGFGQSVGELANPYGRVSNIGGSLDGVGAQQNGSTINFKPVPGKEVVVIAGNAKVMNTNLNCITGMKEYESMSFEELRFRDYRAMLKSAQAFVVDLINSQPLSQASGYGNQNKTTISGYEAAAASQQATGFGQSSVSEEGIANPVAGVMTSNVGGFLGGLSAQQNETKAKFVPVSGKDTLRAGNSITIDTKMYCITGMKDYENKSFEELRLEDIQANRKSGPSSGGDFLSTISATIVAFGDQLKAISQFETGTTPLHGETVEASHQSTGVTASEAGIFPNDIIKFFRRICCLKTSVDSWEVESTTQIQIKAPTKQWKRTDVIKKKFSTKRVISRAFEQIT